MGNEVHLKLLEIIENLRKVVHSLELRVDELDDEICKLKQS